MISNPIDFPLFVSNNLPTRSKSAGDDLSKTYLLFAVLIQIAISREVILISRVAILSAHVISIGHVILIVNLILKDFFVNAMIFLNAKIFLIVFLDLKIVKIWLLYSDPYFVVEHLVTHPFYLVTHLFYLVTHPYHLVTHLFVSHHSISD